VRPPRYSRRWLAAGIGLLLAIGFAVPSVRDGAVRLWRSVVASAPAKQTYIAVLPFRVVGDDAALKDVADGVVDAVSAKLFQLKNVYVASAAAAEAAVKQGTPEKIAKNLGVSQLVQGTVQGGGNNISLVVSLDDIAGKRTVWKQEFPGS